MSDASFSPALFDFLHELEANNERDWFEANKSRYERDIKEPAFAFISSVGPGLREISPELQAIPRAVGGSLMRIYRDVRFSADKRPYKTNVGIQFRHSHGKDVHAPGFYLHLATDDCFLATGVWKPPSAVLKQTRQSMLDDPDGWLSVRDDAEFSAAFELEGESLKTAPRGVDKEHPLIEDLRRKDLIAVAHLDQETVTAPDFQERFLALCRAGRPLTAWVCDAIGAPF
ncbi:MAG: DUF2461 domain-containing protein [Acidobacteriota bacterium]